MLLRRSHKRVEEKRRVCSKDGFLFKLTSQKFDSPSEPNIGLFSSNRIGVLELVNYPQIHEHMYSRSLAMPVQLPIHTCTATFDSLRQPCSRR
jgi:hypothetical protein